MKTWEGIEAPPYFEILPPRFRGQVSTARRKAPVAIGVRLNAPGEKTSGREWSFSATTPDGKAIATLNGKFADNTATAMAELPVPADAAPGLYNVTATATDAEGKPVTATTSFEIVPVRPGQIIADQDGVLLREGKPFFPIGVLRADVANFEKPVDETGLRLADMGFNWLQTWDWDWRQNLETNTERLSKTWPRKTPEELAALAKENAQHRDVLRKMGCILALEGWGLANQLAYPPPMGEGYKFEQDADIPAEIKAIASDPDHFVGVWQLAPNANSALWAPRLRRATRIFHDADPDHPVLNLGHGDAGAASGGDLWGVVRLPRYKGANEPLTTLADAMDAARKELGPQCGVLAVVEAYGGGKTHPTESPAVTRALAYLALAHGAVGICFDCWAIDERGNVYEDFGRQGLGWSPPAAHAAKALIEELKTVAPAQLCPGAYEVVSADGNLHGRLFGTAETGRFLLAVNASDTPAKSELRIPGLDGKMLKPLFGAPAATIASGALPLSFQGLQTAIWRIE